MALRPLACTVSPVIGQMAFGLCSLIAVRRMPTGDLVRLLLLSCVLLPLVLPGCRPRVQPQARSQSTGTLLDSLVAVANCSAPMPRIEATPAFLTSEESCALVQAAKRRLGREIANLPHWQPEDSGAIAVVRIYSMTAGLMDSAGLTPERPRGCRSSIMTRL
jgi:hypothetical protein